MDGSSRLGFMTLYIPISAQDVDDFQAGSGPVHIASGFAALAWSLMLGKRKDPYGESTHTKHAVPHFRPHNPFMFTLGTCLIWWGWFAFNGGSTANLSIWSIYVVVNTNLAAMGGSTTWAILDYIFKKRLSLIGACSGVIAGIPTCMKVSNFEVWSGLLLPRDILLCTSLPSSVV